MGKPQRLQWKPRVLGTPPPPRALGSLNTGLGGQWSEKGHLPHPWLPGCVPVPSHTGRGADAFGAVHSASTACRECPVTRTVPRDLDRAACLALSVPPAGSQACIMDVSFVNKDRTDRGDPHKTVCFSPESHPMRWERPRQGWEDLSQAKGPEKAQPQYMLTQDRCSAGLDSCHSPRMGVAQCHPHTLLNCF